MSWLVLGERTAVLTYCCDRFWGDEFDYDVYIVDITGQIGGFRFRPVIVSGASVGPGEVDPSVLAGDPPLCVLDPFIRIRVCPFSKLLHACTDVTSVEHRRQRQAPEPRALHRRVQTSDQHRSSRHNGRCGPGVRS